ncbi:MAG TPA: flagellar motor protein [Thermodesulfobacteriota bacterium]|jgi:chemotaxis protein MotA|nr:flagellar motor protein [Thermodesulfobacteriota bacterium]
MDKATLIGLFLGFAAIIGGQVLEGGSLHSIMQFTAAVIVMGGTFGAVFVSYPFQDVMEGFRGVRKVLKEPPQDPFQIIQQIITYANKARREGILSLEKEIKNIRDPFLAKALTMSVDGIEPHVIREAMESELEYLNEYGKVSSKVWRAAGGYAPTIGILGAVLGLIHVMENLSDPGKLGAGIAVAFVATVYGVGSANLLFLPMATKLEVRHRQVMILNEMILEGVVALSTGENPRLIEEKLTSFLSDLQKEKRSTSVSKAPAGAAAGKTLQEESG